MAKLAHKLTFKERIIWTYNIARRDLKNQWKEYLIIATAPFVGLLLLYCMAVLQ